MCLLGKIRLVFRESSASKAVPTIAFEIMKFLIRFANIQLVSFGRSVVDMLSLSQGTHYGQNKLARIGSVRGLLSFDSVACRAV